MKEDVRNTISRFVASFNLAGFTYYEGVDVFDKLKIGTKLTMMAEPFNPHDHYAIAIYYKGKKLGFVPRNHNRIISKLMNYGHNDIFELRINKINAEEHPEQQVWVVLKVKEADE